jgi:hypothetical protein
MRTITVLLSLSLSVLLAGACSDSGLHSYPDGALGPDVPGPRIEVIPARLNFDEVGIGCDTDELLRIRNVGTETLLVEVPTFTSEDFGFDTEITETLSLSPDEMVEVNVIFLAAGDGDYGGTLSLASNDPTRPRVDVPLAGIGTDDEHIRTDDFTQNERSAVDVLFIIDNSSSMSQEQEAVADNISDFFQSFLELNLDYHMGVITTDIVNPAQSGRLQGSPAFISDEAPDPQGQLAQAVSVGDNDMGDESGLAAMELALSEPVLSNENAGFIRDDALLSIIILSDEPEQSNRDSRHYIDFLGTVKDDPTQISVSTIVGDRDWGCQGVCGGRPTGAQPGDKYIDVQEAFPGVFESICACDYSPAMEAVGLASAGFRSVFELSRVPLDARQIEVTVNGQITMLWHYNPETNSIEFELDAIPQGLATIYISYPVDGSCRD